ncbi:MAG: hypothetical protein OEU94_16470 [Aquincola sp.]|nr:hypothetical protein [Aquincola sp.]MDH5329385.1 hypothetical protein [Aquincola sp.]
MGSTPTISMILLSLLLIAGCGGGDDESDEGPLMRPGENCMACHAFTVAGTAYPSASSPASAGIAGVSVIVTDANGQETTLTTNAAGNFYTSATLAMPLRAVRLVRAGVTTAMGGAPNGACASCHTQPPSGGAPGRVFAN